MWHWGKKNSHHLTISRFLIKATAKTTFLGHLCESLHVLLNNHESQRNKFLIWESEFGTVFISKAKKIIKV